MSRPLRIFQVLEASANATVNDNRTWFRNLYEPLLDMGHDVVLIPGDLGRRAMWRGDNSLRAEFTEQIFDVFQKENARRPFDLFFSYLLDGMVEPSLIDRIGGLGVPTCNFSCNNAHQFHLVAGLASHFDFSLHSERDVAEQFKKVGATPIWWPMAANPHYFREYDVPREFQVSFVGGNYALRARYIEYLLNNGIESYVAGPGWQWVGSTRHRAQMRRVLLLGQVLLARSVTEQAKASCELAEHDIRRRLAERFPGALHPPIADDELIKLYSRSHISLGFLDVFDHHDSSQPTVRHVHLREFEAPMCGALYCTGYLEELTHFFEPGREIIVYRDHQDLLEQVRYYLKHSKEADAIRVAGQRRAKADHTYHRRFEQLFAAIGLRK